MAYTKPVILAQQGCEGSFAAGCPVNLPGSEGTANGVPKGCKKCERTR